MTQRATEDKLGELHTQVAEVLTIALKGTELPEERDEETGEVLNPATTIPPSAAVLAVALKFLKDNNITCAPSKDNAIGQLQEAMKEREAKRAARRTQRPSMELDKADITDGLH